MATPYSLTIDKVIENAIADAGGKPSNHEEQERAVDHMNMIFSKWATRGVNLWKVDYFEVSVSASVTTVSLDSSIIKPLALTSRYASNSDLPIKQVSYSDYLNIPQKDFQGRPNQVLVERGKDNVDLTFWPVPAQAFTLKFWGVTHFDSVSALSGLPDVPSRFYPALRYDLAYSLGIARSDGSPNWENKLNRLKQEADYHYNLAFDDDGDDVDFVINPAPNVRL